MTTVVLQPSLLDAGRAARDAALERVEGGTSMTWARWADEAVRYVARRQQFFCSDDLWLAGLDKPREPRAMGPVMLRAVKAGICRRTEMTRSSKIPSQHAQPIRVYESLIYSPSPASDNGASSAAAIRSPARS